MSNLLLAILLIVVSILLIRLNPYQSPSNTAPSSVANSSKSQTQYQTVFATAKVLKISYSANPNNAGDQIVQARILNGPDKGKLVSVDSTVNFGGTSYRSLSVGSQIFVTKNISNGNQYVYFDRYRIPGAVTLLIILLALVVVIARWRGVTSMIGLAVSIVILAIFVIPRITSGHNAYATCIEGAFLIATTSIYIAHGFSKRTSVAFVGAIFTLILTVAITNLSSYLTGLTGFTGEDSLGIQYASQHISLAGLLFGGIVIASLGVLNDITIGQAAAVNEIYHANPKQSGLELYHRGMAVGREHIAALVNTLALAYVGVALPAVITTAIYNGAPLLVILNSETVMEEIVRSAVVSISLLLAVPITTALAAYVLPRWDDKVDRKIKKMLSEV